MVDHPYSYGHDQVEFPGYGLANSLKSEEVETCVEIIDDIPVYNLRCSAIKRISEWGTIYLTEEEIAKESYLEDVFCGDYSTVISVQESAEIVFKGLVRYCPAVPRTRRYGPPSLWSVVP